MQKRNANPQPRLPSLDLLKGFEAAARLLSFTRAGEELFLSQSAVSRQILELEGQLGVKLFERRHRALALTEAGQTLYAAAAQALATMRAVTDRLRATRGRRTLAVTTTQSFAALWLIPRLAGFTGRHPELDVRISADSRVLDLERDGLDLAIRHGPAKMAGSSAVRLFGDGRHPWLHWKTWLEIERLADLRPAASLVFSGYEQIIPAAIAGHGVALGRSPLVREAIASGDLVAPFKSSADPARAYYAVLSKHAEGRPEVADFVAWLKDESKKEQR
jgi:DNA-binding transcriptional LysR family regulator